MPNPACARVWISPEQGMPGSNGVIWKGQLFIIFQAKVTAFSNWPSKKAHFFHSLYYVLVAAFPPGTSSKNLELS